MSANRGQRNYAKWIADHPILFGSASALLWGGLGLLVANGNLSAAAVVGVGMGVLGIEFSLLTRRRQRLRGER